MLFINSKIIPVSDYYDISKRMKTKIRPFGFHFVCGQICACFDLLPPITRSPPSCSFLIRQQHKGRSWRNKIACLAFKIKADRYDEVKEKHVHTDVAIDFGELFTALFMQLKIGICIRVCLFLSFVCLFLPLDKDGIFKRFIFY